MGDFQEHQQFGASSGIFSLANSCTELAPSSQNSSLSSGAVQTLQDLAKAALNELMTSNVAGLEQYLDRDAARDWTLFPNSAPDLGTWNAQPALTFGDSKIAFVLLEVAASNENFYGLRHMIFLLRNQGDGWRILYIQPNVKMPDGEGARAMSADLDLLQSFDGAMSTGGADNPPPAAILVDPPDGAQLPRFPERPIIAWRSSATASAAFIVEYQFGWGGDHWSPSQLMSSQGARLTQPFSERAPFGKGRQPHRWRIWTLDPSGEVSLSSWRTINFTN